MTPPILSTLDASGNPPARVQCPTCNDGYCSPGGNCKACWELHHREQEAAAERRRRELIGRLAEQVGVRPDELAAALLLELAPGTVEIVGAVLDESKVAI